MFIFYNFTNIAHCQANALCLHVLVKIIFPPGSVIYIYKVSFYSCTISVFSGLYFCRWLDLTSLMLEAFLKCLLIVGYLFIFKSESSKAHWECQMKRQSLSTSGFHCTVIGQQLTLLESTSKCQYIEEFSLITFTYSRIQSLQSACRYYGIWGRLRGSSHPIYRLALNIFIFCHMLHTTFYYT